MATVTKTVKTTKTGTRTKVKDTSKLSGRQQLKAQRQGTKRAATIGTHATAITGEIVSGEVAKTGERERTKRHAQTQAAQNYQAAIAKWNGILKSTPDAAEGTNDPLQGNVFGNNTTGDNDKFDGSLG